MRLKGLDALMINVQVFILILNGTAVYHIYTLALEHFPRYGV